MYVSACLAIALLRDSVFYLASTWKHIFFHNLMHKMKLLGKKKRTGDLLCWGEGGTEEQMDCPHSGHLHFSHSQKVTIYVTSPASSNNIGT